MSRQEVLGLIGAFMVVSSSAIYLIDIVKGGTRPQAVSWGIWTLLSALGAATAVKSGAGPGAYVAIAYALDCALYFGLGLTRRYGKPGAQTYDIPIGVAAAAIAVGWAFGAWSPTIAAVAVVLADGAATSLMMRDAWRMPETESTAAWLVSALGATVGVVAASSTDLGALLFPAYLATATSLIACILIVRSPKSSAAP